MKKYKDWDLVDELPEGWKIDKTAGSPLNGYEFITNGKSVLNGQKRALLKVGKNIQNQSFKIEDVSINLENNTKKTNSKDKIIDKWTAQTANELARKKFQEKLLQDIRVDLMICEIEGWDKLEYIRELKNLINSIGREKWKDLKIQVIQILSSR